MLAGHIFLQSLQSGWEVGEALRIQEYKKGDSGGG